MFKCLIRCPASSAREVAAGEGGGAGSKWVGDAAHAHERFGVLEVVEAAGAAVELRQEGIEKIRFLAPLPFAGAEVGKVLGARAAGAAVGEARVERSVKSMQHKSGVVCTNRFRRSRNV